MLSRATRNESSPFSASELAQILRIQQSLLEMVALGKDPKTIVCQVCRLQEQIVPNSVASVMVLDETEQLLSVYCAPSVPPEAVLRLNGLRPGPAGGSCANALYRKTPVYVANTLVDPRWQDVRQFALDFNVMSCWSMPISGPGGKFVGSFALSNCERGLPNAFQQYSMEIAASIVGIVLERSKTEESLQLSLKVFENCAEGIMITTPDQRIISVNPAFTAVTGYREDEVIGELPHLLSSGRHDKRFYREMWQILSATGHWQGEIWNRRKNGELYLQWLSISSLKDYAGQLSHYVAIFSDLSAVIEHEAQIEFLAHHDALTQLPNRAAFRDRVELAMALARRSGVRLALLFLDVDNFKLVNDSLGHLFGDALLKEVAARLSTCLRDSDLACRQGGDEFLIALSNIRNIDEINEITLGIIDRVTRPIDLEGREIRTSLSVGIAVFPEDGEALDTLLRKADLAMYHAKESGRNTHVFFDEQMNRDAADRLRLMTGLRQALDRGEFAVYYQPRIDLQRGHVVGAEALIRWNHPELGLLHPGRFIGIAEDSGQIIAIGKWVLHEACRHAVVWNQRCQTPLSLAVNLSALQFRRGHIEETVAEALTASGLDPSLLELELTESFLLSDSDTVVLILRRLKALRVQLALDDFGTGYCSLAYLRRLPVDKLKIDQSFIRDIANDTASAAIVRSVIQLAHGLKLVTIAEGVENERQLASLRREKCEQAQGNFFGEPMPFKAFIDFLDQAKSCAPDQAETP